MEILVINHNGGSLDHGPNLRTYYAAKELVSLGHKVTIASSSYSHKYSKLPTVTGEVTAENIDGIEYRWVRCVHYKRLVDRIFSHFQFGLKLVRNLDQVCTRADVVLFSGPPPEIFIFASTVARKLNVPLISDIRDIWPRTQIEMNRVQWINPFTYFLFFCQFLIARYSDNIVSPLPGIDKYMQAVGAKKKTVIIENGFDTSRRELTSGITVQVADCSRDFPFQSGDTIELQELQLEDRLVVGYAGAFDRDNDIDSFLSSAERFKEDPRVLFLMVGDGIRKSEIINLARSLPNLVVVERVSSAEVPSILAYMDVLFCGLKPKDIYQYGVSLAKSYEYMAAAKPVIWMVQACNNPIAASGGGWTVKAGDLDALERTIKQALLLSKAELDELGSKGRQYLEREHAYNVLGKRWEELFQLTLSGKL